MIKKTKILKAIIASIIFFCFVYWGLDSDFICKVASNSPETCPTSHNSSLFSIGLGIAAAALLAMWYRKD